jgi:hypothetical protein
LTTRVGQTRRHAEALRRKLIATLTHSAELADQHADRAEAAGDRARVDLERERAQRARQHIERMTADD